ncbi:hypothetical protein [Nonomuraea sp. NPDC049725]|uniref:hypothetical protein n=1 Tax=Nonomuraea sp. NPDC049725 TaxID=3154508 RepID=UPI00341A042C
MKHLDRHPAAVLGVCLIHHSLAAGAEPPGQPVTTEPLRVSFDQHAWFDAIITDEVPPKTPTYASLQAEGHIKVGPAGCMGIMRDAVRPLSAANVDQHARFIYAVEGKVITGLGPMLPDEPRWGTEPDRLLPPLEGLGLVDEFDEDEEWQTPVGGSLANPWGRRCSSRPA